MPKLGKKSHLSVYFVERHTVIFNRPYRILFIILQFFDILMPTVFSTETNDFEQILFKPIFAMCWWYLLGSWFINQQHKTIVKFARLDARRTVKSFSIFPLATLSLLHDQSLSQHNFLGEFRSLVRFVTWKACFFRRILYGTAKLLAEMYGYYPFHRRWFFSNASARRSNGYMLTANENRTLANGLTFRSNAVTFKANGYADASNVFEKTF